MNDPWPPRPTGDSPPQPDPVQQKTAALQAELSGLFQVTGVAARGRGHTIAFSGRLLNRSDGAYDEIARRFRAHGFTPLLRSQRGEHLLLAIEELIDKSSTGNPFINLLLLLATIFTTLAAGAAQSGENLLTAVVNGDMAVAVTAVAAGAPFAVTLLGILGIHELGHYVAARLHGVRATLPYFIPLPVGLLGTLGAFIAIRSPMKNRKVLFDIGLSGPIAGFVVALPLLLIGLLLSSTNYVPLSYPGITLRTLGSSVLVSFFVDLFIDVPAGRAVAVHPIFFAAWLGFLLTGINLLPVGQLDGGHVAYALFGRFAHTVAALTFAGLLVAGVFLSNNWLIWAFFIMFGGLRHPPPLNDVADIGLNRKIIGFLTLVLFILIVIPDPFPHG